MSLLTNPGGEVRPVFRVLIFYLLSFVGLLIAQTLVSLVGIHDPRNYQAVLYPLEAIGIFAISVPLFRMMEHQSSAPLGLWRRAGVRLFVTGTVLGLVAMSLVFVGLWFGIRSTSRWSFHLQVLAGRDFILGGEVFFFAAAVEELGFRGYPFLALRNSWGRWGASMSLSLLFVGVHPNLYHSPVAVVSIFLGGVLFTQLFVVAGSLWLPMGFHFGWNLAQDLIFPLSGRNATVVGASHFNPAAWGITVGAEQSGWAAGVLFVLVVGVEVALRRKAQRS